MISADFYPNDIALTNPTRQYSKVIDNLTIAELSGAYYLGWLAWEKFPQCWHFGTYAVTSSSFILNDDTVPQNINIGYLSSYRSGGGGAMYAGAYTKNVNDVISRVAFPNTSYEEGRYINKLDIMGVGIYQYYFWFNQHVRYGTNGVFTYFGQNLRVQKIWDISNYLNFINGESTTDITWNIPNVGSVTVTLSINDIQGNNVWKFSGNQNGYDYEMDVYIAGFSATQTADTTPTGTNGGGPSMIKSCYTINDNGNKYLMHLAADNPMEIFNRNFILINNGAINDSGSVIFNGRTFGGYIGNYPKSFVSSNQTYNYMFDGNTCLAKAASTNSAFIFRVLSVSEITSIISLQCRSLVGTQTKYGYMENDVYATYVTEDNEFTATLITGDLSDDEFKAKLRLWQYDVDEWAENEYTEEDLPPYEPGGDGDDQGSNTGSVLRPTTLGVGGTNGFITQYSMTASQIAEIGRLLWLSFTDPDYYKNFLFTLTTTGTLNISNLLDYFVSLRVYPFPLINVPSHAAAGQDMWIGAGLVPLSFNTNLHTINNYADYIDAGSCTIPRYYNDFRDFAHTQIMLYLPYCGTVQLNPADVVGSTLHAQYAVDFATGGVTAYVDCTTWDGSQFVIAVLTGSIGADIPLTASNAAQIAARIAGDALNFAGTVGEAISSDVGRSAQAIGSAATGDVVGAAIGVANTYAGRIGGALDVAQTGLQIATAESVKMPMLSGGRGFGSFGAPQTAYVQIRRGIYAEGQQPTQGFKEAYGEAYSKPVQVSSCTGFTVFANVDTSGLQCDAMEREQVKKMMQAGIYI